MIYMEIREEKLIFIFDKNRALRPDSLEPKSSGMVSESKSKVSSFISLERNKYGYFVIDKCKNKTYLHVHTMDNMSSFVMNSYENEEKEGLSMEAFYVNRDGSFLLHYGERMCWQIPF